MKRKGQVVRRKRVQKMCMPQCDEEKGITGKGQFGEEKEKRAEKGEVASAAVRWADRDHFSEQYVCIRQFFGEPCHSVPWLISPFPPPCRMLRCPETRTTADSFTCWCTSLPTLSTPDRCPSCPLTSCSMTTSAAWLPSSAWSRGGTGRASRRCRPSRGCWTLRRWTAITRVEPFPVRLVGLASSQICLLGLVVVSAGVVFFGGGWGGGGGVRGDWDERKGRG